MPSKISWCDETINPIVGCSRISAGCQNCYAEKMARRLAAMGRGQYVRTTDEKGRWNGDSTFVPTELDKPFKWKKPRSVFIGSMGDLFHESVWRCWIDDVMRMVASNSQHTFIFLTKRPERMKQYFDLCDRELVAELTAFYQLSHGTDPHNLAANWPLPNLVLGVSVENQLTADERILVLLSIPAAKRFISLEPMIGPVDLLNLAGPGNCRYQCLSPIVNDNDSARPGLDGVILGGESGSKARPMHPEWIRLVRDQCKAAGVPFMFKQWGEWRQRIAAWEPKPFGIFHDGRYYQSGLLMGPINAEAIAIAERHAGQTYESIHRVGSKAAGNSLDGRTHTDLPWETRKSAC